MTPTIARGGAAARLESRVELVGGEFDEPCEVCAVRPTSLLVEAWDDDFEALEKLGESGAIARRYFCAEHEGAADALYHVLAGA